MQHSALAKTSLTLFAVALNLGLSPTSSNAATLSVCASGCDHTSIQTAITNATAGDTIQVLSGTYTEAGITVDKDLTIMGSGPSQTTVQAAASEATASDRVFAIDSGVSATLQDMTIRYGNPVGSGGGVFNLGTDLTIDNCIVAYNHLRRDLSNEEHWGGGIYSYGNLIVNDSTISDNATDPTLNGDDGGGITVYQRGAATVTSTLTLRNSMVRDNQSGQVGGGVFVYNAKSATIINSTIANNTANATGGGGIYAATSESTSISFSTITGNSAPTASAGGIYAGGGTVVLKNSIVAGNTANIGGNDLYGPSYTSQGGNVLGDNDSVEAVFPAGVVNASGDAVGTNASPVDPLLATLADNGGPTQTFALLAQSPAWDLATACTNNLDALVTDDQRGYLRPSSDCDSGAHDHDAVNPDTGFLPFLHMIPIWKNGHDQAFRR